jgi:hypothetical protein
MSFPARHSPRFRKATTFFTEMRLVWLILLCATLGTLLPGCVTPESENASERPWNAQRGWEHGLPSNINRGR